MKIYLNFPCNFFLRTKPHLHLIVRVVLSGTSFYRAISSGLKPRPKSFPMTMSTLEDCPCANKSVQFLFATSIWKVMSATSSSARVCNSWASRGIIRLVHGIRWAICWFKRLCHIRRFWRTDWHSFCWVVPVEDWGFTRRKLWFAIDLNVVWV